MTTVRDQIHAMRWRAAADALDIDPSADPNIAGLAELREAKTARQRLADECHRVADSATQTAAELAEIQDLSERMALLARDRGEALHALGWDGTGDPRAWVNDGGAARFRDALKFLGWRGDVGPLAWARSRAAQIEESERQVKLVGDALKTIGWDGDEHPAKWAPRRRRCLESRTAALKALGWDGTGCPEAWAERCQRVYDGSKPVSLHPVMLELLAPLRTAIGAMGTNIPKRIVELAVQRIEADARDASEIKAQRDKHLSEAVASNDAARTAEQATAAHRWRASDLQAVLSHERQLRTEADNALVESTRPIWPLLGGRFIGSVDGITRRMVQVLKNQHKSLTHNGSIPEFDGPDE